MVALQSLTCSYFETVACRGPPSFSSVPCPLPTHPPRPQMHTWYKRIGFRRGGKNLYSCKIILNSVRQHNHFITQGNYKAHRDASIQIYSCVTSPGIRNRNESGRLIAMRFGKTLHFFKIHLWLLHTGGIQKFSKKPRSHLKISEEWHEYFSLPRRP